MSVHVERLMKIRSGIVRQREIVTTNAESLQATHASGFIATEDYKKYAAQKADTLRSLDIQLFNLDALISREGGKFL